MKRPTDLSIKTKLLVGFIFVALIAGTIGVAGIIGMKLMDRRDHELYNLNTVPISLISDVSTAFQRMRISIRDIVLYNDQERQKEKAAYVKELDATIQETLAEFDKRITTDEIRAEFDSLSTTYKNYGPARAALINLAMSGQNEKALFIMKREGSSVAKAIDDSITKLKELEVSQAKLKSEANTATARTAVWAVVAMSAVGVLIAIVMGIILSRMINIPLRRGVDFTNAVSEGDLTGEIGVERKDEIGELAVSLNNMVTHLREVVERVREAASNLSSAATELHANSSQIASGAEEVASEAENVASAGSEMSTTSMDIARNCASAAEASMHASESAQRGFNAATETIQGMNRVADRVKTSAEMVRRLGERSNQIGTVLITIEDIADQTNLLALNAAIEAARAGEQGRGFAVVADAVRKLAEQTTKATKEISSMVKSIQDETGRAVASMDSGVKDVARETEKATASGQSFREFLERINEVSGQINNIAAAAEEQTATTAEISNNIMRITLAAGRNSQGTNEITQAASGLARLAEDMEVLVNRFKT